MKVTVSNNERHFYLDGKAQFLLADTCWSAFTHPTLEEWRQYLDHRRMQGFNAIQMNLLQQCHSCVPKQWYHPFALTGDMKYDYSRINEAYFDRVCTFLEEMKQRQMVPMIVLVWGNFAPDTMQAMLLYNGKPQNVQQKPYIDPMPLDQMRRYVAYAVNRLKGYDPIFLVSGDVNLNEGRDVASGNPARPNFVFGDSTEALVTFYREAMRVTKENAPQCLATYHICPKMTLPRVLREDGLMDFYMYQPGHSIRPDERKLDRELARELIAYDPRRPVYNSETCYEGNVAFDLPIKRFDHYDVRRAFWQSVLSGACCGFTYGAGGIWLWRFEDRPCTPREIIRQVNNWQQDLQLPGAWEVSFGRHIVEEYDLYDTQPWDGILNNPGGEFLAAADEEKNTIAIYQTYSYPLQLAWDLSGYDIAAIDLDSRNIYRPLYEAREGVTTIQQLPLRHDTLIIARKNKE